MDLYEIAGRQEGEYEAHAPARRRDDAPRRSSVLFTPTDSTADQTRCLEGYRP